MAQDLMQDPKRDAFADTALRPVCLAIVAMGGQGGGVLSDWICVAATASGFHAQATSVPGVAQRTGATIYYIEMITPPAGGGEPVLALMPTPGDVDIVIASELMEAGRSLLRGLVTPDRTTLIASTQRAYATAEKEKPGDGTADGAAVFTAMQVSAKRHIVADFAAIAERNGSVISASLLGALAASGTLAFPRAAFIDAIRVGGIGVDASLKAFDAAFEEALREHKPASSPPPGSPAATTMPALPGIVGHNALDGLLERIRHEVPPAAQPMAYAGVRHLVDYQDPAYAAEYLDRLATVLRFEDAHVAGTAPTLTVEVARHLARAMAYDDVIRVADLKTRQARLHRVARDVAADPESNVLHTTEYFHPRMEEVCATLPAHLGRAIESRPRLFRMLDAAINRGRRIRTDSIWGFGQLYLVALRKPKRRLTLRHGREMAHVAQWLDRVREAARTDYDLAVEIAKARRLIKGYADTMSRGTSKYDRVLSGAALVAGRPDAAAWVRRLHQSARLDEGGEALQGTLATIASLDAPVPLTAPESRGLST